MVCGFGDVSEGPSKAEDRGAGAWAAPTDKQEKATQTVLEQAEALSTEFVS